YCSTRSFVDNSYLQSELRGYISFAANHRDLDNIPPYPYPPFNKHNGNVGNLQAAKNFLYLLDGSSFADRQTYLAALAQTDYDILIIDAFYEDSALTSGEIEPLRMKHSGGSRLVIAYMSIGEAEDYRYYWQTDWAQHPPAWLAEENPDWPGNYKVKYWEDEWQEIICGQSGSYLQKILSAGFDGAYLDLIDAYEFFEERGAPGGFDSP
ncbi:MAG: endo alpha-1,4 polygalactosaminidase, partial [Candidatus Eisenbacteria bacterium]|nr:endo alpha-1,4 polygalactosaminidase [Candidatus Eisenbacteria bacterium]